MELEHSHKPEEIAKRLRAGSKPNYLRDFIYGGIDGAVTTFAIVTGVIGASLSSNIILILGVANLLADGLSMAASNYSGMKSVTDDLRRLRAIEEKHIRLEPEGEREEVRQILAAKGLSGQLLTHAVNDITANEDKWIELMLVEEYGISPVQASPVKAALATFLAFLLCGAVPLLPFALGMENGFLMASIATGLVFAMIGAAKSKWSPAPWWGSALETMVIGGGAAAVAFAVGYLLKGLA